MNLNLCPEFIITSRCARKRERHFPRKEACKYTLLVHVMSLEVGFAMHLKESVDSASDGGYSFIPPGTRPSNSADCNGIPYYIVDGSLKINSYSKGIIIHVIQHYGRTCYSSIQCYDRRGRIAQSKMNLICDICIASSKCI